MSNAFGSALWAAIFLAFFIVGVVKAWPLTTADMLTALIAGGFLLSWLLISLAVFFWRWRDRLQSRSVSFIIW